MTGARVWLLGIGLLVAAWFVAAGTPDGEQRMTDPFPVTAEIGEPAAGDNIAVTIHEVVLADGVRSGAWSADGTWLVVDLDAWTVRTESPGTIGAAYLVVGERTFAASERPIFRDSTGSLYKSRLFVGIPQSGSIAFELPAHIADDPAAAAAVVQLAQNNGGASPGLSLEGDSVIELRLSLPGVARVVDRELIPTEWTRP